MIVINATKNISIFKKCNIARSIMFLIMNVIIERQKFSVHSIQGCGSGSGGSG